jgi:hypothetical protein
MNATKQQKDHFSRATRRLRMSARRSHQMDSLLAELGMTYTEIDDALVLDIGVVSAQFYPARRDSAEMEAIKRLMIAILVDAVRCYRMGQRQVLTGVEALEASAWIFGTYAEFPFSFINVCTELGVCPDRIRQQLRESDKQAVVGGWPKMLRRPPIRTLGISGEHGRSRCLSSWERADKQLSQSGS